MSWFLEKPEKRYYQRLQVDLPVDVVIEGKKISANTSNISCGGMYLPLPSEHLNNQKNLEIIVNLPADEKPVKILGQINRIDNASSINEPKGVAIEFQGLYDDNILAIERFIKSKLH
jgi:hypothetical protein